MRLFKTKMITGTAAVLAALTMSNAASAATVLTFEGIGNLQPVANFYAPDYVFSGATLAIVDSDDGGTGNIANEPSASTVMFFLDSNNAILNAVNGFTGGFSFFYSSATAATVNVWSGLDGTGTLLGTIGLLAQNGDNCTGDPTGGFCNWTNAGTSFAGTAFSIDFGGTANLTAYDNITIGSDVAQGAVPEASTWMMMILGFGMVGFGMRTAKRRSDRTFDAKIRSISYGGV